MTTAILPLSRTARVVALTASLVATTAMLAMNLGLVHIYTNAGAAAAGARVDCSSKELRLSEELVPGKG